MRSVGVTTQAARAASDGSHETLRDQAQLQLVRRQTGRLDWHEIPGEPDRGFALLPAPSAGDLIFDIEGDPFWEPARGLHFLFGLHGADGYHTIWAHDRAEERAAFERLIDFFQERLARDLDMHVY